MRVRAVWGRSRKFLWREGADPRVSEMFYRAVAQAVILLGSDILVYLAAM